MDEFRVMDEFERAGFNKETCERLREICITQGISPERLISVVNEFSPTYIQVIENMKKSG